MKTLLGITEDMEALDALLMDANGDLSDPTVEAAIAKWESELEGDLKAKLDNYALLISELDRRSEARKTESKRLADRAKVDANSADALRDRLLHVFKTKGLKPVETERFKIGVAKNGGKAPLVIDGDVPAAFMKMILEPDKELIRRSLEDGKEFAWAHIGERGDRISIR